MHLNSTCKQLILFVKFKWIFIFLAFCLFPDDLPVIDTDSDLDESEEDAEKDSEQQISDCESNSAEEGPKDLRVESANVSEKVFIKTNYSVNDLLYIKHV